ncbi:MAG: hypothetical protein CMK33_01405 [Porticoccaceae bacterium]|nr:hypothetical protein [Porticoccaceae bacterium]
MRRIRWRHLVRIEQLQRDLTAVLGPDNPEAVELLESEFRDLREHLATFQASWERDAPPAAAEER